MDEKNEVVEAKQELVETKVDENKEKLSDKNEHKRLSGFVIATTVIYSFFAVYVIYIFGLLLLAGILDFDIQQILIGLAGLIITCLPYILLFTVKTKDKKLLNCIVVYELLSIILVIVFFYLVLWPRIKKSINNQWCTMVDRDGNEVPCG